MANRYGPDEPSKPHSTRPIVGESMGTSARASVTAPARNANRSRVLRRSGISSSIAGSADREDRFAADGFVLVRGLHLGEKERAADDRTQPARRHPVRD